MHFSLSLDIIDFHGFSTPDTILDAWRPKLSIFTLGLGYSKDSRIFDSQCKTMNSEDLQTMQEKIEHFNSESTYIVGHSLQMIEDAERIKETFSLTLSLDH